MIKTRMNNDDPTAIPVMNLLDTAYIMKVEFNIKFLYTLWTNMHSII